MKRLISRRRLAERLDRKRSTLVDWVHDGIGPRPVYVRRQAFYVLSEVEAWLKAEMGLPPAFVSPREHEARRDVRRAKPARSSQRRAAGAVFYRQASGTDATTTKPDAPVVAGEKGGSRG